jgi:hypothetical protein
MRILEILLPKGTSDRSISPQVARQIDALQQRMDKTVDMIMKPSTTQAAKDFLKLRLRGDYDEMRDLIPRLDVVAENIEQYEVYDRQTRLTVPNRGPYNSRARARMAVDKLDNAYGAYRYAYRPITPVNSKPLTELFRAGQAWEWGHTSSEEAVANFKVGDVTYRFYAYEDNPREWTITFRFLDSDKSQDVQSKPYGYGITGSGNSAKVFSTVIDIMRDFLSRYESKFDSIILSADEPSRKSLYMAMIKRLLPGWKVETSGYDIRVSKPDTRLSEAVRKLPLSHNDFETVKEVMLKPIPAAIAPIYISEIIDDDELNDQLRELEESQPGMDVRPLIAEWFRRVMPDQMYRFTDEHKVAPERLGALSPIHGYDPHMYKGSTDTGTGSSGNAYGSF